MKGKVAIDLIWVKPGISGGVESYIRNVLDAFSEYSSDIIFFLFTSESNYESFKSYENKKMKVVKCPICSESAIKRNVWINVYLGKEIRKRKIHVCFEPVYSMPLLGTRNIRFITTIHDLNQLHFPQNFKFYERIYTKMCWKHDCRKSDAIIAISNYTRNDIIDNFKISSEKIHVIYNPIVIKLEETDDSILKKLGLTDKQYYYTVSSLLAHKNLETVIKAVKRIKELNLKVPQKLVITGVQGKNTKRIHTLINGENLNNNIILTDYISVEERNSLYKHCFCFVFPSVFEGFGMPPVEAMNFDVPVITTRCTSIPEITQNRLNYVDDPFSVDDWVEQMKAAQKTYEIDRVDMSAFSKKKIAEQYTSIFRNFLKNEEKDEI